MSRDDLTRVIGEVIVRLRTEQQVAAEAIERGVALQFSDRYRDNAGQ